MPMNGKLPICGAKRKGKDAYCQNRAGFRTDHEGDGRCYLHGGRNRIKHGRWSRLKREALRDAIDRFKNDPKLKDLAEDVAFLRAIIEDFIDRYDEAREALLRWNREEVEAGGRPAVVYDIAFAGELIAKLGQLVERMAKIESMSAVTLDVVDRLMLQMAEDVLMISRKYVPDDAKRQRFLVEVQKAWGSIRLDAIRRAAAGD